MLSKNENLLEPKKLKKAEYKSATRSKNLIQTAFAALLQEKTIDKITVVDIVKKAGINRGTFYAHYATPHDVYIQISTDFLSKIAEVVGEFDLLAFLDNPYEKLHQVSIYLMENIKSYRLLAGLSSAYSFVIEFKSTLVKMIMDQTEFPNKEKNAAELEIIISFLSGGLVMVYFDWVGGKTDQTIEQVEETLCKFISTCKPGITYLKTL